MRQPQSRPNSRAAASVTTTAAVLFVLAQLSSAGALEVSPAQEARLSGGFQSGQTSHAHLSQAAILGHQDFQQEALPACYDVGQGSTQHDSADCLWEAGALPDEETLPAEAADSVSSACPDLARPTLLEAEACLDSAAGDMNAPEALSLPESPAAQSISDSFLPRSSPQPSADQQCWLPDDDLADLQQRLQHAETGRSVDLWLGLCTVAAGTAWWGYQSIQRFLMPTARPRAASPVPRQTCNAEAQKTTKVSCSRSRRRSLSSAHRLKGGLDGTQESKAGSPALLKAAALGSPRAVIMPQAILSTDAPCSRSSGPSASARKAESPKPSNARQRLDIEEGPVQQPVKQRPLRAEKKSSQQTVRPSSPAIRQRHKTGQSCGEPSQDQITGAPVQQLQLHKGCRQVWPSSPTSPLELAGGDSGSETASNSSEGQAEARTRLQDIALSPVNADAGCQLSGSS
ncbi:hypothetical protein WJX84_005811 [Apatococcus fuscideae]|uniref:Uncharacterized protein n=1 Tax=Apatococcus fuscideae TaxID=2026836 RepID=A0AAW1SXC1_9CHLO